jgi:hypothetical protein
VSHSTLHEFVQRHVSTRAAEDCAGPLAVSTIGPHHLVETRPAARHEVRERIETFKREPISSPNQAKTSQFDGTQPLRLKSGKTNRMGGSADLSTYCSPR